MTLRNTPFLLVVIILLGCSGDDPEKDSADLAIARASIHCSSSPAQLAWLRLVIHESETDASKKGIFYTFQSNGRTIIMHQPWIMSCLGCILYDCDGNRLDMSDLDPGALSKGFQDLTVIYEPVF